MECNEDGFTDENLKAICAVGKSSKSGSEGYIGEKGIGFKSVFMAAWKARIQSGVFSFSFRNDQAGMGMISPVWEDDFEELSSLLTRLTLYLDNTEGTDTQKTAHQIIQEQFDVLPETILLFMKNLRMIRVSFYSAENELETSSVMYSIERPQPDHAILRRTTVANNTRREHVKHYHVATHQAKNIPRHENRTYSNWVPSTSQVVLAFPLSETSVPIIEPQDVFVYLPVRPMGFKFIIQADFVTDASRQDIVRDSPRNFALLDGVAEAFSRAVLQFCGHDGLRLQWMRYLPDRNDRNWGSLWLSLVNKIANRLSQTPVLYCHKKFDRHPIGDLVRLASDVYADGEPLFEDGDRDEIVSQQYENSDLEILISYGLKLADWGHILRWIAADLNRGAHSRMRSSATTNTWHTQAAKLLHQPFAQKWAGTSSKLKEMALLPLKGGTWVTATSGPVYFAKVDGIDIPPRLGLRIVDDTVPNTHRKRLFEDLGVQTAPKVLIRRKILEIYETAGLPDISLQLSKQHLEYLYLTHHLKDADEPPYSRIAIFGQDGYLRYPSATSVYMATDRSPYSPWGLLRGGDSTSSPQCDAPRLLAHYHFMNDEYFLHPPETPQNQALTWTEWFHSHLYIRKYVYLGKTGFSDAAKYLQNYRPERFLGALRIHYLHNRNLSPEFIKNVQNTEFLCRGAQKVFLKDAYVPIERLEVRVARFVEHDAFFPWLWLDTENLHDIIPEEWDRLLRVLKGGKLVDDVEFALDMLRHSVHFLQTSNTSATDSKLFDLYSHIQIQKSAGGVPEDESENPILYTQSFPCRYYVRISNINVYTVRLSRMTILSTYHLPIQTLGCIPRTVFCTSSPKILRVDHRFGQTSHVHGLTDIGTKGCTSETAIEVCPEGTL